MIKKQGKSYGVYDSSGKKKLGTHPSRKKALEQVAAIEASKAKRKKAGK